MLRPIPGLESKYRVTGWSPDGSSVYVTSGQLRERAAKLYQVNVTTGKMDLWKTFGGDLPAGVTRAFAPRISGDGSAYAYVYQQDLSVAYVVKGLK